MIQIGLLILAFSFSETTTPAFSVTVSGEGSKDMILIPGLGCSGKVWGDTVAHFSDDYRLHVVTLAGFAGEAAVEGPFLTRVRDDLRTYIKAEKLHKPIVMGHSLGGFMAFSMASTYPDVLGAVIAVDGVPYLSALGNPMASVEASKPFAEVMRERLGAVSRDVYIANTHKTLTSMITDPAQVEQVLVDSSKSDPKVVAEAVYEMMTTDLRSEVHKITVPVLLIGAIGQVPDAMREQVVSAYKAQIATIDGAEMVVANTRHFVMLDDPLFFQQTVASFLNGGGVR